MFTVLFWNLNQRPLEARVSLLARNRGVDLVALAECRDSRRLIRSLNADHGAGRFTRVVTTDRLTVCVRFAPRLVLRIPGVEDARHFLLREIVAVPGVRESIVIAVAHLPSKLQAEEGDQSVAAAELARTVVAAEDRLGHTRTLLVGDMNMNPFEPGVVNASCLHGVMTRTTALAQERTVAGRKHRYFYNPMWRFFGDGNQGPPGSYYYDKCGERCYFWNVFDQALVRPSLLDHFPADGVEILDSDGVTPLLGARGRPDRENGSDHLPILVRLDL